MAAVLVLASCRDHETITGGYGVRGVSGVVTMAVGMSNSSPAGVRVGVGGTGMSAVLGTDGRFSFFGVPATATLTFTRDDVSAQILVTASPAPLRIELNSNGASVGRRRAAPSAPLLQIEGLITAISPTEITVHDSHNEDVTATITADTIIRKGDQALDTTGLNVGDRVHVKAKVSGDDKVAVIIMLQNPDDDNENEDHTMTANGTVKAVGADQLTVSTVPRGDVVVKVDGSTIIKKQGDRIALSDIHVNDQVNTMGKRIDDQTLQARQIEVRGVSGHH
ncbi:MAG TPA: DUF5666 domain-containing protein [Thermoanaerobaculia bacterium]|nr:DUF5666 domain-containing protein [Thermoanaerobaculia bacterium]